MLLSILKFPAKMLRYYREAKHSSYTSFKDKWEVWRVLTVLRIKSEFQKNKEAKPFRIFNYKVQAYRYSTLMYLFRDIFINNPYQFNYEGKAPVIIDCGANIGMSVLYLKSRYPEARIIAFEPNPYAFQLLEKNMAANEIKNVELYNEALSDSDGELNFFINNNDKGTLHGSLISDRGGDTAFTVKTKKLSAVIEKVKPDLVKMDVEGAEIGITDELQAAGKLGAVKQYVLEYHHQITGQKPQLAAFLKKFENEGFKYNMVTDFTAIGSFQDIIIIFTKP